MKIQESGANPTLIDSKECDKMLTQKLAASDSLLQSGCASCQRRSRGVWRTPPASSSATPSRLLSSTHARTPPQYQTPLPNLHSMAVFSPNLRKTHDFGWNVTLKKRPNKKKYASWWKGFRRFEDLSHCTWDRSIPAKHEWEKSEKDEREIERETVRTRENLRTV